MTEKVKINIPLIKGWVSALRSGTYKQGKGHLCRINTHTGNTTYCCLGVLEVVAEKPHDRGNTLPSEELLNTVGITKFAAVGSKAGLTPSNIFWTANDSEDKSFAQIADLIEEKLLGVER